MERTKKGNLILGYNVHLVFCMLLCSVHLSKQEFCDRNGNSFSDRKQSTGNANIVVSYCPNCGKGKFSEEKEFVITVQITFVGVRKPMERKHNPEL